MIYQDSMNRPFKRTF